MAMRTWMSQLLGRTAVSWRDGRVRSDARRASHMLGQAARDGKVLPTDKVAELLAAIAGVGALADPATRDADRATFYASYAWIAGQTLDLRHDPGVSDQPFEDALSDAELLLKHAAETGVSVEDAVVGGILTARSAQVAGTLTDAVRLPFFSAYAKLAKNFGNVTAESIRNCASIRTRRSLQWNRYSALCLTLLVSLASVFTFVANTISSEISENVRSADDLAVALRTGLRPSGATADAAPVGAGPCIQGTGRIALPAPGSPPSQLSPAVQPAPGAPAAAAATAVGPSGPSSDEVRRLQRLAEVVRDMHRSAIKLNTLIGFGIYLFECDPFGVCQRGDGKYKESAPAYLEIDPAISNYTASALCKITTLQLVRSFSVNVNSDYKAVFGALAAFGLPILYSVLGAMAYRLRQFADTIRQSTYHPSFADSARLITAAIAGAISGLFNPAQSLSLSPLAIAFLVGYGVELFFLFLDSLLTAFGPAKQQAAAAK